MDRPPANRCHPKVPLAIDFQVVYIRFVGTHAEYEKMNAEEV
jgi:mRNA-degrading endonuclease HigB of HigAB toxin-antitoxin module